MLINIPDSELNYFLHNGSGAVAVERIAELIREAQAKPPSLPRIVVEISGGVCTAIACDQPARVLLIDHDDIEAAGEDEPCIPIPENSDEWTRHVNDAWSNAENGAQK